MSGLGTRLGAAVKQLAAGLHDTDAVRQLISDRRPEMRKILQALRDVLDIVLEDASRSVTSGVATSSCSDSTQS